MAKKFSGRFGLNDQAKINATGNWMKNDKTPYVDVLAVGGGGAGGSGFNGYGGGGGGGGSLMEMQIPITPGISYTVAVGAGGTGMPGGASSTLANNGEHSRFQGVVGRGGGAGNYYNTPGNPGGCGGGGGGFNTTGAPGYTWYPGAPGRYRVQTSHGFMIGGTSGKGWYGHATAPGNRGGGGGGSYQLQDPNHTAYVWSGWSGGVSWITGQKVGYGAGGSGGAGPATAAEAGGPGGVNMGVTIGGTGGVYSGGTGSAGATNTGSGGGGGGGNNGTSGNGGSGIVVMRFPDIYADPVSVTGTYNTANSAAGFKVYTWTSSGSVTF